MTPIHPFGDALVGKNAVGDVVKLMIEPFADRIYAPAVTNQQSTSRPSIVYIIADNVLSEATSSAGLRLAGDYAASARRVKGTAATYFYDTATSDHFLNEIEKTNSAVVFVGHSIKWPIALGGDDTAVGLYFDSPPSLLKKTVENVLVDPRDGPDNPYAVLRLNSRYLDNLRTTTKVAFVAACYVGPQFLSWWNIDDSTPDRALVVPDLIDPTAQVDLWQGSQFWLYVQRRLVVDGFSLKAAVDDANETLGISTKYKVIGAQHGAKIKFK